MYVKLILYIKIQIIKELLTLTFPACSRCHLSYSCTYDVAHSFWVPQGVHLLGMILPYSSRRARSGGSNGTALFVPWLHQPSPSLASEHASLTRHPIVHIISFSSKPFGCCSGERSTPRFWKIREREGKLSSVVVVFRLCFPSKSRLPPWTITNQAQLSWWSYITSWPMQT